MGHREETLRRNLWDSEDRLRAVDLNPEADTDKPLVAAYTYDASGERTIKYVPGRFDARYSAKETGNTERLEAMLYPSPLLTVKTLPIPEGVSREELERLALTKYTNHYYIGSERITSALGTLKQLGILCEQTGDPGPALINLMDQKVDVAGNALQQDYGQLDKTLVLPPPFHYNGQRLNCDLTSFPELYSAYWYHPDHLGSSSYITNLAGEITQHMEYLPFGETLVEEHLNSNNSPYKFNAKEYDAETGNYYYGARYYNPKWSIWLSIDPLAEKAPNESPYVYVSNSPIAYFDPDGKFKVPIHKKIMEAAGIKAGYNKEQINSLQRGVAYTDKVSDAGLVDESSFLHFDGLKNSREVKNNYARIQNDVLRVIESKTASEFHLGFYVHAIQDFYSHSNYAELHLEFFGADSAIITYEEVMNDSSGKYNDFKSLLDKNLHTGEFNLAAEIFGEWGESIFGYDYKKTHAYLNKDNGEGQRGELAVKLAEKESVSILKKAEVPE